MSTIIKSPLRIPITQPYFGQEERDAIVQPLDTGWVVQGPLVQEFERRFCEFTESRYAAATTSCTTALQLAIAALGVKPGDEVIVPAFTWVATPNVVEWMHATPVFCDISLDTFNIDVTQAAALVTPRTVGIIPVHLFGLCAEMSAIAALASRHRLWVLEDAACAFGAYYRDRHAGTFGDAGCFSFHPRKSITTGEGGMVTTGRADLHALIGSLRDHGASRTDRDRHESAGAFLLPEYPHLGFNYRMTDLQGALGCVQMNRARWLLRERARVASRYSERLADLPWLACPSTPSGYTHGWQSYVCLFQPDAPTLAESSTLSMRRNALMASLEARGIATRQGTHAPVLQQFYREKYGFTPDHFPNATIAERISLSLPLFAQLSDDDVDIVVTELARAFRESHD
jgi:perosamine synthetase